MLDIETSVHLNLILKTKKTQNRNHKKINITPQKITQTYLSIIYYYIYIRLH